MNFLPYYSCSNSCFYLQEYETVMKGLDRNAPSVPPQNTPQEAQQVDMWKKYIQWEKSNPLRTEDQTLITKRGTYRFLLISFCI